MSIPNGISYIQNLDGTYNITYYDPSNPPKTNVEYNLIDTNNYDTISNDSQFTSENMPLSAIIQGSFLNRPFTMIVVKENFTYKNINFNEGDLLFGNVNGDNNTSFNLFDPYGNHKTSFYAIENVYFMILYPDRVSPQSLIPNSIITTNPYATIQSPYGPNSLIRCYNNTYIDGGNNSNSGELYPNPHFLNVDKKGNIYYIYEELPYYVKSTDPTNLRFFGSTGSDYITNNKQIQDLTPGQYSGQNLWGFSTNNINITSFFFDDENYMYINVVSTTYFHIYKYRYDGSKFVNALDNGKVFIEYTSYVNKTYFNSTTENATALGTYIIEFDNDKNIYISVVGSLTSKDIASNYTILKFDTNGNIVDEKYIVVDVGSNNIYDYVSFSIYNNYFYFLSPTQNTVWSGDLLNIQNYFTFENAKLYAGSNVLAIKNNISNKNVIQDLSVIIPFTNPDTP